MMDVTRPTTVSHYRFLAGLPSLTCMVRRFVQLLVSLVAIEKNLHIVNNFGKTTLREKESAHGTLVVGHPIQCPKLTRESERMDGQMRNTHDKGDERWYKVRYREERYTDLLAEMLRRGTAKHGEEFHLGRKKMRELMPFYVKKAGKETCVCIHHLIWDKMISDYARE